MYKAEHEKMYQEANQGLVEIRKAEIDYYMRVQSAIGTQSALSDLLSEFGWKLCMDSIFQRDLLCIFSDYDGTGHQRYFMHHVGATSWSWFGFEWTDWKYGQSSGGYENRTATNHVFLLCNDVFILNDHSIIILGHDGFLFFCRLDILFHHCSKMLDLLLPKNLSSLLLGSRHLREGWW